MRLHRLHGPCRSWPPQGRRQPHLRSPFQSLRARWKKRQKASNSSKGEVPGPMTTYVTQQTFHVDSSDLGPTLSPLETDLRRQLVRFGRWVHRLGYTPGIAGNLSVRLANHLILATPTGCSQALLRPADMTTANNQDPTPPPTRTL